MPSELKSETSRINGAKSHGPKTPEGKEASSRNSLKHGFTARNTYILECESADEYKNFLAEHIAIHQPATPPEKELVEQMAIARWRIRRFMASETVLIDCEVARNRDKVEKEFATLDCHVHVAMAIRSLADESRALSLMSRYESRHQRAHDKAYTALRELQRDRTASPSVSEGAPGVDNPSVSAGDPAAHNPSVSAGDPAAHNPSVSAGDPGVNNKKSPNEPTVPTDSSHNIHVCTPIVQVPDPPSPPPTANPEDPAA